MLKQQEKDKRNNTINIAKGVNSKGSECFFLDKNSSLTIGNHTSVVQTKISLGTSSTLKIGANCRISGEIFVGAYSNVEIGDDLSVTSNLYIRAVENTTVKIGKDCLFAANIKIRTADGHPIYDRATRERLNKSKDIQIGNHVWIGDEAVVLKGAYINKGSVIAMRSIVTNEIPEFCAAAGIPAKIIKKNIIWERSPGNFSPEYYPLDDAN